MQSNAGTVSVLCLELWRINMERYTSKCLNLASSGWARLSLSQDCCPSAEYIVVSEGGDNWEDQGSTVPGMCVLFIDTALC